MLCMKKALQAVRKWRHIPDSVTDEEILGTKLIDPSLILLIMQIVQQIMACLPNAQTAAWNRVRSYEHAKPFDRLMDNMRLNGIIQLWLNNLGIPREQGDVALVRNAVVEMGIGLKQTEFEQLQLEMQFYTI